MAAELIHGALILGGRTGGDGYEGGRWLISSREPRVFSCSIKSYVLLHLPPIQRSFQSSLCTMQLSLSFSFLLTTLLFTLAQVEAFPTKRSPRTVTLPLKRLSQPSDVHPSNVSPTSTGKCCNCGDATKPSQEFLRNGLPELFAYLFWLRDVRADFSLGA